MATSLEKFKENAKKIVNQTSRTQNSLMANTQPSQPFINSEATKKLQETIDKGKASATQIKKETDAKAKSDTSNLAGKATRAVVDAIKNQVAKEDPIVRSPYNELTKDRYEANARALSNGLDKAVGAIVNGVKSLPGYEGRINKQNAIANADVESVRDVSNPYGQYGYKGLKAKEENKAKADEFVNELGGFFKDGVLVTGEEREKAHADLEMLGSLREEAENLNNLYENGQLDSDTYVSRFRDLETRYNAVSSNVGQYEVKTGWDYYDAIKDSGAPEADELTKYLSHYDDSALERVGLQLSATVMDYINTPLQAMAVNHYVLTGQTDSNSNQFAGELSETTQKVRQYALTGTEPMEQMTVEVIGSLMPQFVSSAVGIATEFATGFAVKAEDVSGAMMGVQQGVADAYQMMNEGYQADECVAHGLMIGTIGYLTEKTNGLWMVDSVKKLFGNPVTQTVMGQYLFYEMGSLMPRLINTSTGMISEGWEEYVQAGAEHIGNQMFNEIFGTDIDTTWDSEEVKKSVIYAGLGAGLLGTAGDVVVDIQTIADYNAVVQKMHQMEDCYDKCSTIEEKQAFKKEHDKFASMIKKYKATSAFEGKIQELTTNENTLPSYEEIQNTNGKAYRKNIQFATEVQEKINDMHDTVQSALDRRGLKLSTATNIANVEGKLKGRLDGGYTTADIFLEADPAGRERMLQVGTLAPNFEADIRVASQFTDAQLLLATKHGGLGGAYYDPVTKEVVVNINSEQAIPSLLGHEFTHMLEKDGPAYQRIKEAIGKDFSQILSAEDIERYTKMYEAKGLSDVEINALLESEAVAKYIGDNIADKNFVKRLLKFNDSAMYRMFSKVKGMFNNDAYIENVWMEAFRTHETEKVQDKIKSLSNANDDRFAIKEKNIANGTFSRFSEQEVLNKTNSTKIFVDGYNYSFKDFIKDIFNGKLKDTTYSKEIYVGKVGPKLSSLINKAYGSELNIEGYNVTFSNTWVNHAIKEHSKANPTEELRGQRPITEEDFEKIPDILANPTYVVYLGLNKDGNKTFNFISLESDGTYVVTQFISDKRHKLSFASMRIGETFEQKKNLSLATNEVFTSSVSTSETDQSSGSINNISNKNSNVNLSIDENASPEQQSRAKTELDNFVSTLTDSSSFDEFLNANESVIVDAINNGTFNDLVRDPINALDRKTALEYLWAKTRLSNIQNNAQLIEYSDARNTIKEKIGNVLETWTEHSDSKVKEDLVESILSDPEVFNAGMSVMYETYLRDYESDYGTREGALGFEEYLNTPVELYRSTSGNRIREDAFSSYATQRYIAEEFLDNNGVGSRYGTSTGDIETLSVLPKDTYGMYNPSEREVFVPSFTDGVQFNMDGEANAEEQAKAQSDLEDFDVELEPLTLEDLYNDSFGDRNSERVLREMLIDTMGLDGFLQEAEKYNESVNNDEDVDENADVEQKNEIPDDELKKRREEYERRQKEYEQKQLNNYIEKVNNSNLSDSDKAQLLSDYIPDGTYKLVLSDLRLDDLIRESGYGEYFSERAKGYITKMSPEDFLALTTGKDGQYLSRIEEESTDLDIQKLRSERQSIRLYISEPDSGKAKVIGHEGRHRMVALRNAGINSVPVYIECSDNKYNKTKESGLTLVPQVFRDERYTFADNRYAHNLIPVNESYRDEIRQEYGQSELDKYLYKRGGGASVQYNLDEKATPDEQAKAQAELDEFESAKTKEVPPISSPENTKKAKTEIMTEIEKDKSLKGKIKTFEDALTAFKDKFIENGQVFIDIDRKHKSRTNVLYDWYLSAPSRAQFDMINGIRFNDGTVGKSLTQLMDETDKLKGQNKQLFSEYLYNYLNIDRMTLEERKLGDNKQVLNNTAEESKLFIAQQNKQNPDFQKLAEEWWQLGKDILRKGVEDGIITEEQSKHLQEMYPHYVPVLRDFEGSQSDNKGKSANRWLKRAEGGTTRIRPLYEAYQNYIKNFYTSTALNDLFGELYDTAIDNRAEAKNNPELLEDIIGLNDFRQVVGGQHKFVNNTDGMLTFFRDGKNISFAVDDRIIKALDSDMGKDFKPLVELNSLRRNLITSWNYAFGFKNGFKDYSDANYNTKYGFATYNQKYAKSFAEFGKYLATGELSDGIKLYLASGGLANRMKSDTSSFKLDPNIMGSPEATGLTRALNFAEAIEMVPRYAEFLCSLDAGNDVKKAMYDASEITLNFKRGGKGTKWLDRHGVTFLNSSVLGTVKQIRNVDDAVRLGPRAVFSLVAKYALLGLPAQLWNHFRWKDDKDYEELSDYVKKNYLIIHKTKDGEFVRVPYGRIQVLMNTIEKNANDNLNGTTKLWDALVDDYLTAWDTIGVNNPLENNIYSPYMNVKNEKTWYGTDMIPYRLRKEDPEDQWDETTDEISKLIGRKLRYSPIKINYLLDQYTGVVGDTILPMFTPKANQGTKIPFVATMKDAFVTDATFKSQIPSDYYDMKEALEKNAGRSDASNEAILQSKAFNSMNKEVSDLYAKRRQIFSDTSISSKEQYEKAKEVQKQINNRMKQIMDTCDQIDIDNDVAIAGGIAYKVGEEGWEKVNKKSNAYDYYRLYASKGNDGAKALSTAEYIASIESLTYNGKTYSNSKAMQVRYELERTGIYEDILRSIKSGKTKASNWGLSDTVVNYDAEQFKSAYDKMIALCNGKEVAEDDAKKVKRSGGTYAKKKVGKLNVSTPKLRTSINNKVDTTTEKPTAVKTPTSPYLNAYSQIINRRKETSQGGSSQVCARCGSRVPANATRCPVCGASL